MNFIVVSITICSLLVILFLLKSVKLSTPHILLSCFYFIIICVSLNYYSFLNKIDWLYISTNILSSGTGYLIGAIIYLYVCSLFQLVLLKSIVTNLIPFLIYFIFVNIPFAFSNPIDGYAFEYLKYIQNYGDEIYLIELSVFFYFLVKANIKRKSYQHTLQLHYSTIGESQINWVKQLLYGATVFITIDFAVTIYLVFSNDQNFPDLYISILIIAFITFYISYHGLYKSRVFIPGYLKEGMHEYKKRN